MARRRGRRAYATDLTDAQWALIASLIPEAEPGGRPRKTPARELVNAILYFLRAGIMQATYEAITSLTDAFCREHLNEDYRVLAQRMTAALCRKHPSPLASGQPRTGACGIIYVLGQINFLTDPSTQPFMTTADLCARFGVGQSTASAKARVISQALDHQPPEPRMVAAQPVGSDPAGVDGGGERRLG